MTAHADGRLQDVLRHEVERSSAPIADSASGTAEDRSGADVQPGPARPTPSVATPGLDTFRCTPCRNGIHQGCLSWAVPTACDCHRRDHALVVDRAPQVVLPDVVPSPTVIVPNPRWHIVVLDVAAQLAHAEGARGLTVPHVQAAERLLYARLLGQAVA